MRIEVDSNGNHWFENLTKEGFKQLVNDFKNNEIIIGYIL